MAMVDFDFPVLAVLTASPPPRFWYPCLDFAELSTF